MGDITNKYGKLILLLSLVIMIISLVLCSRLDVVTNFSNLMPEDHEVLEAQLSYEEKFGLGERVYVVVKGQSELRHQAIDSIESALKLSKEVTSYYLGLVEGDQVHYLDSKDNTMSMIVVEPKINIDDFADSRKKFLLTLNDMLEDQSSQYESLEIGFTGGNFVQDDEADRVMEEGIFSTLLATLIAVILCVVIAFRRVKLPLFLGYPLLFGVVVTAGIGYLIFKEFNVFSVFFAVVLLGLGIDFGVHFLARYIEALNDGFDLTEAVNISIKTTGVSIMIGALTTAGAFFAFAFTDFKGFQQMGVLAGIGIMVLAASMIILVPCIIPIIGQKKVLKVNKTTSIHRGIIVLVILMTLTTIMIALTGIKSQNYIYNIQETYPENMSSSKWQKELERAYETTLSDLTVMVDSLDEIKLVSETLEKRPDIEEVISVLSFLPQDVSYEEGKSYIPKVLLDQYVSGNHYRVDIKSSGDIWDSSYYNDLKSSLKDLTGNEIIGFSSIMIALGQVVIDDVVRVSIICIIIIVILLFLLFKSPSYVLLAFMPMMVSTVTTYGLMYYLRIPLNIISIIAFPMIIGISIDSSVHLVHRLKHGSHGLDHTLKAILLTGVTTMIGFGALATINHRGLASLGATVTLGILTSVMINYSLFGFITLKHK